MSIGIYKIESPSGKIYVGQSINIEYRFKSYLKMFRCKNQIKLFNSFQKYGPENHIFEIIELCEFNELNNTSKHKFRNLKQDVNQWIIRDWQLASNNFIPRETNFGRNFNLELEFEEAISAIINQKYKMICLKTSIMMIFKNYIIIVN